MRVVQRAMHKPALLFYCQHSLGMGHLVRGLAIAAALERRFDVQFLNGGRFPAGLEAPQGLTIHDLPPLGMTAGGALTSLDDRYSVESAKAYRQAHIRDVFRRTRPAVILIELFPFGRKKFADELIPLLDAAIACRTRRPIVVCSLRDILVEGRGDQQRHDDRAARLVNKYFDAVIVHADPRFARIEESFHPRIPLSTPILYSGFVHRGGRMDRLQDLEPSILVSAGGGMVGGPLFRAALAAHRELWATRRLPMRIVAGPFLPDAEWDALISEAEGMMGLTIERAVPDLAPLMGRVAVSISQCGYNTSMDIVAAGVPALVVPFAEGDKNEQRNRADRLEQLGIVKTIAPDELSANALVAGVIALLDKRPPRAALDLDGASRTTSLIERLIAERSATSRNRVGPRHAIGGLR